MQKGSPIIQLQNVSLTYNKDKPSEFRALKNISLQIYPEEFVIFFGPSGSGKSTLLYIIAGLETPTTGTVSVDKNKDVFKLSEKELITYHRSTIGMIFQAFYLIQSLTAKDNILLPMIFAGASNKEREETVNKLLDRFGITTFKDRTPAHLSGGQQQRVAIARSLINNPAIVLADEPVGNLDSKNSQVVLQLITELRTKDKKTVILVTHDPSHLKHADKVVYLKDGEVTRVVEQNAVPMEVVEEKNVAGLSNNKRLIDKLALLYPQLDETQLKAKLLTNLVMLPYDIETIEKVEGAITQFLKKEITHSQLFKKLDGSTSEEGINLYTQTAEKIVAKVQVLVSEEEKIESGSYSVEEVVRVLLSNYQGTVSEKQKARLRKIIAENFSKRFTEDVLTDLLDKPFSSGGIGLNHRTALHFAQELQVLLTNHSKTHTLTH